MKKEHQKYLNFYLGENNLCRPEQEVITYVGENHALLLIYKVGDDIGNSFEEFTKCKVSEQWFYGGRPPEAERERILVDAWNFLILEHRENERWLEGE